MADVTGNVVRFRVGKNFAKAIVRDQTDGSFDEITLWVDGDGIVRDRVTESTWISIVREAMASNKRVFAITESAISSRVSALELLS